MKTKREILKDFANGSFCKNLKCVNCPYTNICYSNDFTTLGSVLTKIGAMAILRMFPEKKKHTLDVGTIIKFDNGEIATVVKLKNKILLFFESHKEKLDYLIGKNWEVVE